MINFRKIVATYLREVADRIDVGNSEINEKEALRIMSIIAHEEMSKEQACSYLNLSRSRFDDLVRAQKLPKGKKRVGFKELRWYKDELDGAMWRMKNSL